MPMVPKPVSDRRVAMGGWPSSSTVAAWLGYLVTWFFERLLRPGYEGAVARTEEILYLLIVTLLTVSALAYLLAGSASSTGRGPTTGPPGPASTSSTTHARPTLTTIIPSYQEDERVIRTTLLSAALQEYPDKRIVLLIDDPLRAQDRAGPGPARVGPGAARQDRAAAGRARRAGSPARCESFELATRARRAATAAAR